jgi:hypothetical protein
MMGRAALLAPLIGEQKGGGLLCRGQGRYFGNLFRQFPLGDVQVVFPLQIEPQIGAIAEELLPSLSAMPGVTGCFAARIS